MPNTLPSAPEAEASLLGTMLVYASAARIAIEEGLNEDDFYLDVNRRVFTAVQSLYHDGSPVDLATVSTRLKDQNQLDAIGGLQYLTILSEAAVTSANTKNYVNLIHDKAIMRRLIEAAQEITAEGMQGQEDVNAYLDDSEKKILNVSRNRRTTAFRETQELVSSVVEGIRRMSEQHSDITGVKTGFDDLDHTTHGFQRGDLIILAARPAMGKTAVSLNLAMEAAICQPKQAVCIFSLEMPAEQLAVRMLSARSGVTNDKLKTGNGLNDADWNKINEAASELKEANIYIDDSPSVKVADIFSKARHLQAEHPLALIVVDYIQLITGSSRGGEFNRQQEVSDISRNLKALARELKVPVIALSQLSRSVESRENKRPMLSDLRESGALEQDADIVMMLYREAYYDEQIKAEADKVGRENLELNIAKHRNGQTRKVMFSFEPDISKIMGVDNYHEE